MSDVIKLARVFSSIMPEEILVEKAIKALEEYKRDKFPKVKKGISSTTEVTVEIGGLKEFFKDTPHTSVEEVQVIKPFTQLITLIMKWQDEDMSTEEIMGDVLDEESVSKE